MDGDLRNRMVRGIWRMADALARHDDDALRDVLVRSRSDLSDIYRVMKEYGVDFGSPPAGAYDDVELDREGSAPPDRYFADVYLWTADGRPTDLSVILSIAIERGAVLLGIDDVRVM